MSAELATDDLVISRTFDAPAALVFAMWARPEHMRRWMGPHDFECREAAMDFRVGGAYRVMIASAEHGEQWFGGVYRQIEPNRRLVFTFAWDNDGPSAGVEMLISIVFEERDGKTVQTFHQTGFLNADRRDSHFGGWSGAFHKQQTYVQSLTKEHSA